MYIYNTRTIITTFIVLFSKMIYVSNYYSYTKRKKKNQFPLSINKRVQNEYEKEDTLPDIESL